MDEKEVTNLFLNKVTQSSAFITQNIKHSPSRSNDYFLSHVKLSDHLRSHLVHET